jgi:hypothetical protein
MLPSIEIFHIFWLFSIYHNTHSGWLPWDSHHLSFFHINFHSIVSSNFNYSVNHAMQHHFFLGPLCCINKSKPIPNCQTQLYMLYMILYKVYVFVFHSWLSVNFLYIMQTLVCLHTHTHMYWTIKDDDE